MLPLDCPALMHEPLFRQLVRVESGGHPWAIGVVGGQLQRQPRSEAEAVATAAELLRLGHNFSIGVAQVNRVHFGRLGWLKDLRKGFELCANATAGAEIYNGCYRMAMWRPGDEPSRVEGALSCYYSGDLTRGVRLGYVQKVLGTSASVPGARGDRRMTPMMPSIED